MKYTNFSTMFGFGILRFVLNLTINDFGLTRFLIERADKNRWLWCMASGHPVPKNLKLLQFDYKISGQTHKKAS